jgi:hypothetical protein
MSRRSLSFVLSVFAVLAIATPMMARDSGGGNVKPVSVTMDLFNGASLGDKALKPGTYQVTADESKVTLKLDGKVVAEAPIQWKDTTMKANRTSLTINKDQITEIHFGGKTRYAEIAEGAQNQAGH